MESSANRVIWPTAGFKPVGGRRTEELVHRGADSGSQDPDFSLIKPGVLRELQTFQSTPAPQSWESFSIIDQAEH